MNIKLQPNTASDILIIDTNMWKRIGKPMLRKTLKIA